MNFLASDPVLESAIAEFVGGAPDSDNAASPFLVIRNPIRKPCRTRRSAIYIGNSGGKLYLEFTAGVFPLAVSARIARSAAP